MSDCDKVFEIEGCSYSFDELMEYGHLDSGWSKRDVIAIKSCMIGDSVGLDFVSIKRIK